MTTPCQACLAKPSSIDGHAGLGVRTLGGTLLTFECRHCNALWARSAVGGGFSWSRIEEGSRRSVAMGTFVPPCSDPFEGPDPSAAS